MSGQSVCRWGVECRRQDCWFLHPTGRLIDSNVGPLPPQMLSTNVGPGLGMDMITPMMAQMHIASPGMQGMYPVNVSHLTGVTKPLSESSQQVAPQQQQKKGPAVCRYGRECRRAECWFTHPEGREIDSGEFTPNAPSRQLDDNVVNSRPPINSPDSIDFDAELDEFEAKLDAENDNSFDDDGYEDNNFDCPCCNNNPQGCTGTPQCKSSGICVCQMGMQSEREIAADDTWRDEWFPSSRNCACCNGYAYRCAKQDVACTAEECFCMHKQTGESNIIESAAVNGVS